jgi:large subunit ribosomal protein L30
MKVSDFLNKKILIKQIKSDSKLNDSQKGTLIGLGLRGVNTSSRLTCSNSILGMIKKVHHLIKIENI